MQRPGRLLPCRVLNVWESLRRGPIVCRLRKASARHKVLHDGSALKCRLVIEWFALVFGFGGVRVSCRPQTDGTFSSSAVPELPQRELFDETGQPQDDLVYAVPLAARQRCRLSKELAGGGEVGRQGRHRCGFRDVAPIYTLVASWHGLPTGGADAGQTSLRLRATKHAVYPAYTHGAQQRR